MFSASSWILRAALTVAVVLCTVVLATSASAAVIDASLNVIYNNPSNVNSGGTWHVVAKSDGSGIAGLELLLTGIDAQVVNVGPRGTVNGSDPAGFSVLGVGSNAQYRTVGVGQFLIHPSQLSAGEEQAAFYGVGTLTNGAPNFPGKPAGTNSIGPTFTTLTNVQGVPWATGDVLNDPAWNTAARLVSGTFAAGVTPGFFDSATVSSSGNLFTSVGDNRNPGPLQTVDLNTFVRTNFTGGTPTLGDYNGNGRVDAADFVVWRKTLNQAGAGLPADGDNDGRIDQDDYNVWRRNFGRTAGSGAGLSTSAVPEPASAAMLAFAAAFALVGRPSRKPRASHKGKNSR